MNNVGYIDDNIEFFKDYQVRLKRLGIDLLYLESWNNYDDIYRWIVTNSIACLIVDFKLAPKYMDSGTNVVAYINSQIPDLPCIILTSFQEDSVDDNLVVKNLILDRDALSALDLSPFSNTINQFCEVFRNRLVLRQSEYDDLYKKKESGSIVSQEEERFIYLFQMLRAYGEIDDLPATMLQPDIEKKVDSLLIMLDEYINSHNNKQ